MYRDPTEFRLRFAAYQGGKLPYENGRPKAIQEVDNSDADFAKRLRSNWRLEIWDWEGSGKSVTHKMSDADNIVYPNVQTTEGGGLIDFTNPIWRGNVDPYQRAIKNNDYVPMKSEQDAMWFGPNYKKYYPGFKTGKLPRYTTGTVSESEPLYDSTIDFLKRYEGFKDTTYLDGNGIPTIGYGFTDSSLVKKGTISRAEADRRLKQEVAARESVLSKMKNWDKLSEDSKTALRSYYYNYPAGFKPTTKFMKAWNAGNYEEAIRQVDAGMYDKKNPGLRKRRLEELALLKADPFLRPVLTIQPTPIVNQPVSTAVRPTIPAEQTVSAYDPTISPYISGKPMIKLRPRIQLPNLIELMEDSEWEPGFPELKNGKLPGYYMGTIPFIDEEKKLKQEEWSDQWQERLLPSARSKVIQKWNATGSKPKPESSEEYTKRRIKEAAWKKPSGRKVIDETLNFLGGDVKQTLDAGSAVVKGNYTEAGFLGAGLFLPNVLKKSGKLLYKGLRKTGAPRWFAHDIVQDPKRVVNDWVNGQYAFTKEGVGNLLKKDNEELNVLGDRIKLNVILDELILREKRMNFARSHGILNDIVTDKPKDANIQYIYDTKMNPKFILGQSSDPITVAYYEHPISSRFKYKWDKQDGYELPITLGHEFTHRLESDYTFSPNFKTSSSVDGKTGYKVPAQGFELVTNGAFHMPSARSLMDISEVQQAFSPTITRYNTNINRIAEANMLGINPEFATHVWHSSPAEVVADLKGAIASGMDEKNIYNFMYYKHGYDGDQVRLLRNIGYKNGKLPGFSTGKSTIHIKPANRGKLTALKKRTGKSESELYNDGNLAHKKMVVFARNARKWHHK